MSTIKTGDRHPITFRVNTDLTGCTVRLLARAYRGDLIELPATVTDPAGGIITHVLDGALDTDGKRSVTYNIEVEATRGAEIVTFPNDSYGELKVIDDLD